MGEVKRKLFSPVTELETNITALFFFRMSASLSMGVSRPHSFFFSLLTLNELSAIPYYIHSQNNNHFSATKIVNGNRDIPLPCFFPVAFLFINNLKKNPHNINKSIEVSIYENVTYIL